MPAESYGAAGASGLYERGNGKSLGEAAEAGLSNLEKHRKQLSYVRAASVQMETAIFNFVLELVPAISEEPARTAMVEALASDNTGPITASAASSAAEAEGGGGQHAAAANAPPYQHTQGRYSTQQAPGSSGGYIRYKDPAVVELLRTKCAAGKTEKAVRAKTMQNLDALMTGRLEADRVFLGPYLADKDEQAAGSET